MSALRRKAVQSVGRLPAATRSTRPYSSGQHGKTGDGVHHSAGSSTEHGHHTAGPQNESLGVSILLRSIDVVLTGISSPTSSSQSLPSLYQSAFMSCQDLQQTERHQGYPR
jgi:hypothetical protein